MRGFVDRMELENRCRLPGGIGVAPSREQSLALIPGLLAEGEWESAVVLAFDGLGYDHAAATLAPDRLTALTTTFPSTSVTAWATVLTGATVEEHGLAGVRFRAMEEDRLVDCFAEGPAPGALGETVFERLSARGVRCSVNPGEMATWPAWWRSAVTRGATPLPPFTDWEKIRYTPEAIVRAVVEEVEAGLARRGPGRSLVWSWINVDDCVHRSGPSAELDEALRRIGRFARRLAAEGHTVLALSDHGAVPSRCSPALAAGFAAVTGPGLCALPPGGAGRVRWCYPRPGRAAEVAARLAGLLGPDALVVTPDELAGMGLLTMEGTMPRALGEVVCLAVGAGFPVPDPEVAFEHGSVTAQEMIVPLAAWEAS
ncbi:Type I phosphodiesterase / nucleotide pyrophosphatase [Nonomuraea solani]|uniref:Type I phosphodiesterase / nucleotide pyrophosphatase n=1 Tax=Nonomuraea solani TaxID=1144553 RepID=A0A1H6ETC4_9ACTN|nr:alkaline phosphatase family protein [Nonomuraea solani]SEH01052.1 Type I phosphodiesterase / nucleotide pyrophosphatase [Nonomuraea solani]